MIGKMDIIPVQLEDKHYRTVRGIFRNTFDRTDFPLSKLNLSWHYRSKDESYAFFLGDVFIGFIITSHHMKNRGNLYVDYIAFKEEYRGEGLRSIIMTDMLKQFKELGRSVHLYPERESLWPWYERLGFHKTYDGYYNFHSYDTRSHTQSRKTLV